MSKLRFDGRSHQIALIDDGDQVIGTWAAYNNVDRHSTLKYIHNGTYFIQDKILPHAHSPDENGPYGLFGIIRFLVSGHPGIGVHSGRAHARHKPGPQHPTMGCIRTTDTAMGAIRKYMATDPLETINIQYNSPASVANQTVRSRHERPGVLHHG